MVRQDSVADVAVVNLVAIAALLVGCFAAGLVAQSAVGRKVYQAAAANLAGIIPGCGAQGPPRERRGRRAWCPTRGRDTLTRWTATR